MTAEVAVMSRLGIALAADSAVTVGAGPDKIFASAEKLFLLAESAPVGAMIYGDANLLGIPWETIVKMYRRYLGRNTFLTLEGYATDFLDFLRNEKNLFPASAQEEFVESVIRNYYLYIFDLLRKKLETELDDKSRLKEDDIKAILSDLITDHLEQMRGQDSLQQLPADFSKTLREKFRASIASIKEQIFGSLPMTRATSTKLTKLVLEAVTRRHPFGDLSGVVLAGFGENEHLPCLIELMVRGVAADQVLFWRERTANMCSDDMSACVMPFAQGEMVGTFMEGIDPQLKEIIAESTITSFHGVAEVIIEQVKEQDPSFGQDLEERVSETLTDFLETLLNKWDEERKQRHSRKIMEMVGALPKDELAAMAEGLVNLTKFRRRVSREQETVGGPIDVAVITKGDGFVWVKRKHYFIAELNPRFMSRYYKAMR